MSNYTILLIDYEPKSIDRVRRPLMGIGYRVEVATDGISGIEAFHRLKPDLVMVEAMIPKKHGFEVCQEIKKSPQGKRTPVIITTSVYKGRKYRNQAFHLHGCDEYIEKPIDEEQVVVICRRMVGDNGPIQSMPAMGVSPAAFDASSAFDSGTDSGRSEVAALEFPPVPPAPPGMDDDEFEIMSKLDSILSGPLGGGGSRPSTPAPQPAPMHTAPAPAPIHTAPPPAPTVPSAPPAAPRDMFATSFFPSSDTTQNQDFAPRPLGSTSSAAVSDEPQFLTPIGESPEQSSAPLEEHESAHDSASSESHRTKRKERRKKATATSSLPSSDESSSEALSAEAVSSEALMLPAIPELTPTREEFATADLPPLPTFAEPDAEPASQTRTDPFESMVEESDGGSRWFVICVVVVLLGAAAALFMYMR